jgi:hypothetical protein
MVIPRFLADLKKSLRTYRALQVACILPGAFLLMPGFAGLVEKQAPPAISIRLADQSLSTAPAFTDDLYLLAH